MPKYLGKCKCIKFCYMTSMSVNKGEVISLWKISEEEAHKGYLGGVYGNDYKSGIITFNEKDIHGLVGSYFDEYFVIENDFDSLLKKAKLIRELGDKLLL